jgi:DNA-binding NtrC family response regulator/pSer/pThr/pTyr-binding forkhead associated (FHA) protein
MSSMSQTTSDSTYRPVQGFGGYELLVTGDGDATRLPLPEQAELLIGRAPEADVRLDGNSVSRRHAVFRVRGTSFSIEDLGSSNGTLIRGRAIAPQTEAELTPGESVVIGEFVLVLRAQRSRATPRHVWPLAYLEARVAEQAERSRAGGGVPFFLVSIETESEPRVDPTPVIAVELAASDVLGRLTASQWCVLLVDDSDVEAEQLAARLARALDEAGCPARVRVIGCPRDGISGSALMACLAHASESSAEPVSAGGVVLRSPAMLALYTQLEAVAKGSINVLILGETGVGKDVLAQRIHERSERREKPFLRLNCATLAEPLLESELFGHEKGAFTGATHKNPGLLQSAHGGTVFLDEIGEFPQRLQPKLLQVLETRQITSVGSVRPRSVDVRFIAATNRDLEAEALAKNFRSDLYYRLAGFTFVIPPLRERREDIAPLALEFLRRVSQASGLAPPPITDEAMARLLDYPWPGNARELRNVIERAWVLSEGRGIRREHLPLEAMGSVVLVSRARTGPVSQRDTELPLADLSAEELAERQQILDVLSDCAGNQSKAAEVLGISRSTLVNRLNAYRIRRPRKHRA